MILVGSFYELKKIFPPLRDLRTKVIFFVGKHNLRHFLVALVL